MSLFYKTPIVKKKTYNSSAYFTIEIPEEGSKEGIIHYIILFRPDGFYEIFVHDHETTPSIKHSILWKITTI